MTFGSLTSFPGWSTLLWDCVLPFPSSAAGTPRFLTILAVASRAFGLGRRVWSPAWKSRSLGALAGASRCREEPVGDSGWGWSQPWLPGPGPVVSPHPCHMVSPCSSSRPRSHVPVLVPCPLLETCNDTLRRRPSTHAPHLASLASAVQFGTLRVCPQPVAMSGFSHHLLIG